MDAQSEMLLQRAAALRRAGRIEEAIAAYRQLLAKEPELPDSWYNLGWLQRQARDFEAALASYAEALKRGVRDPEEVHLNRAVILSDQLARPDEARAELEAALALKPDYLPALLNVGNLHEDRGNREAAQVAYRRALAAAPNDTLALSRLAGVVDSKSAEAEQMLERLSGSLATAASPAERADLGFALGRLLDARGEYETAFAAYEAANLASRQSSPGYDRAAQEAFVNRSIETFAKPTSGNGNGSPVFIVGMFRSGSTLLEQILAGHSRVQAGGELDLIPALARQIPGYPEAVAIADEPTIAAWRDFYTRGVARIAREGALLTDKRPDNFLHIGLIKRLFPHAKIVHTRRNRLDNLLSLYFLHLGREMPYALDLEDAAHWYDQYERLMAHWKALYSNEIFEVDYDELVRAPKPIVERLLACLDLQWEDRVLDFTRSDRPVKTASVWQVREPLHARSSGRWRNYSAQVEDALGKSRG